MSQISSIIQLYNSIKELKTEDELRNFIQTHTEFCINQADPTSGITTLMLAANEGNSSVVELLIACGAKDNQSLTSRNSLL
jgi:hypothetical protein